MERSTSPTAVQGHLARRARVTVVVPTLREVENIPLLVERLRAVRASDGLDLELLLMDDDSRDGSEELVRRLGLPWVRLIVRTARHGLSDAVLDGLRRAEGDVLVVMDADLSHPPEKIPALVAAVEAGADMAVGSRFVEGGSTDDDWGLLRWLNSRAATLLARPLTALRDPMSGFFALRRGTFLAGSAFDPIGYKIGLELLVKCRCRSVLEIPIHFSDRRHGRSKLSLRQQLEYLRHLRRLYIHRYGTWSHLAQFLAVGCSGLVVNLAALTALLGLRTPERPAVALAIAVSMIWNFALNRRFSFSYARSRSIAGQFLGFVAACSAGAVVNYFTTLALWQAFHVRQVAAALGVLAGTALNFVANRFVVFRMQHVKGEARRPPAPSPTVSPPAAAGPEPHPLASPRPRGA